jgi:hypothetical protein
VVPDHGGSHSNVQTLPSFDVTHNDGSHQQILESVIVTSQIAGSLDKLLID